jgi:putative redox protein
MTAEIVYSGELHNELTHSLSGTKITTDAPPDNQGNGASFSPTDLAAASAGACALTIMGIAARKHHFNMDGTRVEVSKVMASNPRRIAEVHLHFYFPKNSYSDKERVIIEHAARTCPVILSLNDEIKKEMIFDY